VVATFGGRKTWNIPSLSQWSNHWLDDYIYRLLCRIKWTKLHVSIWYHDYSPHVTGL
jgi:hypothetical protein